MKTIQHRVKNRVALLLLLLAGITAPTVSSAQDTEPIAITELMSWAADTSNGVPVASQSDFFELTSFADQPVNLQGWSFTDYNHPTAALNDVGYIQPGESIIFFRKHKDGKETQTVAEFRAWWGLPESSPRVFFWTDEIGFDNVTDCLRIFDSRTNLVDQVAFGVARRGVSWVSCTNGQFECYSRVGICGGCKAATSDDIGSPGTIGDCQITPLQILDFPSNQVVCSGSSGKFVARAVGLPRPKYRWFFNDRVLQDGFSPSLKFRNVWPTNEGIYELEVYNGLTSIRGHYFSLTVNTNPTAPILYECPSDLTVYIGQTGRFSMTLCAFPVPTFQWFSNGVAIPGATQATLRLPNCQLSMNDIIYCVMASNYLGSNSVCARLTVTPKPDIRLTELMADASDCTNLFRSQDWFELTNFDDYTHNLLGSKFSDSFRLETATVITQAIYLQPGRSAIFVEGMTASEFRTWWGSNNIPSDTPIYTFYGFNFSPNGGDGFYLWNAAAEDPDDTVVALSYAIAWPGVSLQFDTNRYPRGGCDIGCDSVMGSPNVIQAVECEDIGSPGVTTNMVPQFIGMSTHSDGTTLTFLANTGRTYEFYTFTNLGLGVAWGYRPLWLCTNFVTDILCCQQPTLGATTNTITATNWLQTIFDPVPPSTQWQRWYLLKASL